MKLIEIQIEPAPADLLKYIHHTLTECAAESLRRGVEELTAAGLRVHSASGFRNSVPNSYRSAYKLRAPFWVYKDGKIEATSSRLENRPRGASIPECFVITGEVETPAGFRCFRRGNGTTILRRA